MYDFLDKIGLKAVLEAIKGKMPTSLPANGGNADYAANADKLDGLHADDFIKANSGGYVAITGNLNVGGYIAGSNANSSDHNHALLMGHNFQDYWDFFEYGGLFRFYKSQSGTDTLLGKITSNGWEGNVVGDVTGSINGWSIYNHINDDNFDADNAKSIGIYRINSYHGSNLPTANGYGIFVINNGGYITQFAIADNATMYIRYYDLSSWHSWREVYTSGNKPYVTGETTFIIGSSSDNSGCFTYHGFMPSAVLYWTLDSSNTQYYKIVHNSTSFNEEKFVPDTHFSLSAATKYGYIIFK